MPPRNQSTRPDIEIEDPVAELKKKWDFQTTIILSVLVIGFVALIITVFGVILEAWHFNSAVYKEYSEKMDTLDQIQSTNKNLQVQIQQDQEMISDQQKQILNMLGNTPIQKK